jgi:hypothetical protein
MLPLNAGCPSALLASLTVYVPSFAWGEHLEQAVDRSEYREQSSANYGLGSAKSSVENSH